MTRAADFLALHDGPSPLLVPNPWDVGSAKVLAALGFSALATTSSGAGLAQGVPDGGLGRDETLAYAARIVGATALPVTADLEDGFGATPADVAATIRAAVDVGLAGASVEDWDAARGVVRPLGEAVERVAAAVEAAGDDLVLTARAENHFRGVDDLDDTLARLAAYAGAGAHVLYAPGLTTADAIAAAVQVAGDRPLNVLAVAGVPPVAELARLGVRRVSVGGAFAFAAYGALVEAADELRDHGTYGYLGRSATGRQAAADALD